MSQKHVKRTYLKLTIAIALIIAITVAIILTWSVWPAVVPVFGIMTIAVAGLVGSNLLYDRGIPNNLSRRFAPVMGGLAYLGAILWLDKWTAFAVSVTLTLLIIAFRLGFRRGLRGVRGTHPAQIWAEITYPVAGTLSLFIGWGLIGNKWLAFLPIAFMAWGDTSAGIAREAIGLDIKKSAWHMGVMLAVCLIVAAVWYRPFWIGAVGAAVATLAERFRPGVLGYWDDNLNIIVASLAIMYFMARISF
jgi:dolichol kinase